MMEACLSPLQATEETQRLGRGAQIQIWEVKLGQFNSYFFIVLFTLLTAYLCAIYEMAYSLAHN